MRPAAIDDLVFQAAPLGEVPASWPPSLCVHIGAGPAQRAFTQPLPLFARRPPMAADAGTWPAYCGLLKRLGVPLQASATSLESVSVANVPLRLARRSIDEGFDALELDTAELIEISCQSTATTGVQGLCIPHFPLEISAWHELKTLVETLRDLSTTQTPIGLGIVAGDVSTDMANALAARADFVILEMPSSLTASMGANDLDLALWSVVAARAICRQVGVPAFPIYVDAPLTTTDHLIKLLALGASAVSIDGLAHASLPTRAEPDVAPKGLLSGIGALPPKGAPASIVPLEKALNELIDRLRGRLYQQQLSSVDALNAHHLRALSESAARLANVELLRH